MTTMTTHTNHATVWVGDIDVEIRVDSNKLTVTAPEKLAVQGPIHAKTITLELLDRSI